MTIIYVSNYPPIKGVAWSFYTRLNSQADTDVFQSNPTFAAGDIKVSQDDDAAANITDLPTVSATDTKKIKVTLTAAEMNGNQISLTFSDQAGAEWQDSGIEIETVTAIVLLDDIVEGTLTIKNILRLLLAIMTGKASGGGTTTIRFRDLADTKDRVVETVDSSGNRSGVTLDGS